MPHRFPNTANSAEIVGRTPRSAWGVLVPHPEQRGQHLARREGPTGASAADQGVRPTTYADCPLPGKLCSIGPGSLSYFGAGGCGIERYYEYSPGVCAAALHSL